MLLLSSLPLLVSGITAAACVTAVACIPTVFDIPAVADILLVPDFLTLAGLPSIAIFRLKAMNNPRKSTGTDDGKYSIYK